MADNWQDYFHGTREQKIADLVAQRREAEAIQNSGMYQMFDRMGNRDLHGSDPRQFKWDMVQGTMSPRGTSDFTEDAAGGFGLGRAAETAVKWAGMGVSGVNNWGSKNLANQADWAVSKMAGGEYAPPYPTAGRDGLRDFNTFTFFLPELFYGQALPAHDTTNPSSIELSDNYEVLKNAGVPDYAAVPIASIHDGAVDPFGAFGFLRAAKMPLRKGLGAMAWDFGPEAAMRTTGMALDGLIDKREYVGR